MITVDGLVGIRSLGLSYLAGKAGGHRLVTWAHAVDLPDPWRWVAAGNLVMTVGAGIPRDAAEQAGWLARLADTNASALVVAPGPDAPPLGEAMLAMAETRMFPLLAASFDLEFVKLSRRVIESVLQAQRDRFDASQRLFQTYAAALRDEPETAARLDVLGRRMGAHLQIEDADSGVPIVAGGSTPLADAVVERIAIPGRARAVLRLARLNAPVSDDLILDGAVVGLLAVELERLMIERDAQRQDGETLLRDLTTGTVDLGGARDLLQRRGLDGTIVTLAVVPGGGSQWTVDDVHLIPELSNVAPLFLKEDVLLAVVPDRAPILAALQSRLGDETRIGVSGPITIAGGYPESVRQARLALSLAGESGTRLQRYDAADAVLTLGPKTVAEARAAVARYLGPLIDYDRSNGLSLLDTLATFIDNDGSWKATAADLGIHRQTLVYRLKVIEQLTGLKPTTSSATARFWVALQAGRSAGILPPRSG